MARPLTTPSLYMQVLLLIPWLAECEQPIVYPDGITFRAPAEQEDWVRAWVEKRTGFASNFDIRFYPGVHAHPSPWPGPPSLQHQCPNCRDPLLDVHEGMHA